MDRTYHPLDTHAAGVAHAADAGLSAGMPELAPFVAELGLEEPLQQPSPLPHDEEEMDEVIFSALVSPYV